MVAWLIKQSSFFVHFQYYLASNFRRGPTSWKENFWTAAILNHLKFDKYICRQLGIINVHGFSFRLKIIDMGFISKKRKMKTRQSFISDKIL